MPRNSLLHFQLKTFKILSRGTGIYKKIIKLLRQTTNHNIFCSLEKTKKKYFRKQKQEKMSKYKIKVMKNILRQKNETETKN